jgi:hypothetical protein
MADQQHMIGKIAISINASRPGQAAQLQQQLSYRLHTQGFMQQLETLLNGLVGEDEYLEIPRLTISLQCADEKEFHEQLLKKLSTAINEQVKQPAAQNVLLQNDAIYTTAVRAFFLKYGIRAFYNGHDMISVLQQEIKALPLTSQPALEQLLMQVGKTQPQVWIRLYYILGAAGMQQFFLRVFSFTPEALQAMISEQFTLLQQQGILPATAIVNSVVAPSQPSVVVPPAPELPQLWQALFLRVLNNVSIVTNKTAPDSAAAAGVTVAGAAAVSAQSDLQRRLQAAATPLPAAADAPLNKQLQQGLLIDNAGLVLLWMECGRLFRELGYIVEKRFADETAQQRAILLLHYIAWGDEEKGEEAWLLNKLFCGWALETPVDPSLVPDDTAKQAAEAMMIAYLEAWRKDRKFSTDWLRRSFLQREGLLYDRADENLVLEVSSKTEDILINKVSMVRYAWMPHILFVRW